MTDLSPAARSVLDAFLGDARHTGLEVDDLRENVAAALRAAALHCKRDTLILLSLADELDPPSS
jgi:hypothetical protein